MTLKPSRQESPETGGLTASSVDSRARTSVFPASGKGSKESDPACGQSMPGSFAFYDRETSSWRMFQQSLPLFADADGLSHLRQQDEFTATWPKSGMCLNGIAYRRPRLVQTISAGVTSWLPTPRAEERGQYQRDRGQKGKERPTLTGIAKGWTPTPAATDWKGIFNPETVKRRALESTRGVRLPEHASRLEGNSGKLNPEWVEWLMGFPIGWTDLGDSATPLSHKSQSGSAGG